MLLRAVTAILLALPLAAADIVHKALVETPFWGYHVRSGAWVALSAFVLAGCLGLTRVPSLAVAIAAGVTAGGVAGNLVSAVSSERGVQNPIVVETDSYVIAFNLADVFTLVGIALLMGTLIVVTAQNRARLLHPRAFVRELRRRYSR